MARALDAKILNGNLKIKQYRIAKKVTRENLVGFWMILGIGLGGIITFQIESFALGFPLGLAVSFWLGIVLDRTGQVIKRFNA